MDVVAYDPVCASTKTELRLVANSIEAHIKCSSIWPVWLSVSETGSCSRIFDLDVARLIWRGMSLVRTRAPADVDHGCPTAGWDLPRRP